MKLTIDYIHSALTSVYDLEQGNLVRRVRLYSFRINQNLERDYLVRRDRLDYKQNDIIIIPIYYYLY